MLDRYGSAAPIDAQYFDTLWSQFLKAEGGALYVCEYGRWSPSRHEDGVEVLQSPEVVPLPAHLKKEA